MKMKDARGHGSSGIGAAAKARARAAFRGQIAYPGALRGNSNADAISGMFSAMRPVSDTQAAGALAQGHPKSAPVDTAHGMLDQWSRAWTNGPGGPGSKVAEQDARINAALGKR